MCVEVSHFEGDGLLHNIHIQRRIYHWATWAMPPLLGLQFLQRAAMLALQALY